jgi:hypothetical protein
MRRAVLRLVCVAALLQAGCAMPIDQAHETTPPPLHLLAHDLPHGAAPSLRLVAHGQLLREAELPIQAGLVRALPPLVAGRAQHRVMEPAEVRAAPDWSAPTVARLRRGQEVGTLAQVAGRDWFLVSDGGVGVGYLPGRALGELRDVPGAPLRAVPAALPPSLRRVSLLMPCATYARAWQRADGQRAHDQVEACRAPTGWQITALPAAPLVAQAP